MPPIDFKPKKIFHSAVVYTAVADLVHHVRNELTSFQLARIVHVYSSLMHNPALGINLHTLFAKMMFGLTDAISTKESNQGAARLIGAMFETCLERLEGLCAVYTDISASIERAKNMTDITHVDSTFIEKARPVGGAVHAIEKPEEVMHGQPYQTHCPLT